MNIDHVFMDFLLSLHKLSYPVVLNEISPSKLSSLGYSKYINLFDFNMVEHKLNIYYFIIYSLIQSMARWQADAVQYAWPSIKVG